MISSKNDKNDEKLVASAHAKQLSEIHGEFDSERMSMIADDLRKDMERQSLQVRDLILEQPPLQLLGYLWAQIYLGFATHHDINEDGVPIDELIQDFQFALEYLHAVWSCHAQLADEKMELNVVRANELLVVLDALKGTTMNYCLVSADRRIGPKGSRQLADTEFSAKSSWVLIRGNRYQVLEEEFFGYILKPHADALLTAYGLDYQSIAAEIQVIVLTIRGGMSDAFDKIQKGMEQAELLMEESGIELAAATAKLREHDNHFATQMSDAMHDLFFGGICNLSRHTNLPLPLLEDLSFLPGENSEFFADGDFKGTPMRTLPARIKPGIKLGDDYYVADGQFIRDSTYRAIQRGLLYRLPSYRGEWNRRQTILIEQSFPAIFCRQFAEATIFSEVYYRNPTTGQWVETDLVIMIDDVLIVVEAKAGVMAMHSPATNFERHERAIRALIIKAYEQCKRFTEYLSSAPEVPLYNRVEGEFVKIGCLQQRELRVILPIGLTVESFTPFSAMSKDLAEIQPLLGKHPFVSMSVDDLFILNRFLSTTGELLHYLEVRQQAAGIPNAVLFDEIDHLGAYIKNNRFDMDMKDHLNDVDVSIWGSFSEVVDKHFKGDTWKTATAPHQEYPRELMVVLRALDEYRPTGWLEADSHIRNLNGDSRNNFASLITKLKATLSKHPKQRFLIGNEKNVIQVYVCRRGSEPKSKEMRFNGEVGCLATKAARIVVLLLSYDRRGKISKFKCTTFASPPLTQADYADLKREAQRQRVRRGKLNL